MATGAAALSCGSSILTGAGSCEEWTYRRPGWDVVGGAVSLDEQHAFLSYHGGAEGIDRVSLGTGEPSCARASRRGGCFVSDVHGDLEPHAAGLLANTDDGSLLEIASDTGRVRRVATGLDGNHVVAFAVPPDPDVVYVAGSCLYRGGYSRLSAGGRLRTIVPIDGPDATALGKPCGERMSVGGHPLVAALAQTRRSPYADGARGSLAILNPDTGRVQRTLALRAPPVDVLVTQASGDRIKE